jgi:hypothetical protein
VIDGRGDVSSVADKGSTLRDPAVVACVHRALSSMAFPAPEKGVATVVYRLRFVPTSPTP